MARASEVKPNQLSNGVLAWSNATGGVVLMLLIVQFLTGVLLAFYYVPSVDHAYTTVSFIEKVLSSGSWVRSLHHYGSQWLALFAFLHLVRLRLCEAYRYSRVHWIGAVALLGLVMAEGATGYSLPWDARAFFSTRVAEGLLAGLPLVGRNARLWLLGGSEISTLTLSRFFALHVLVISSLILAVVLWQLLSQSNEKFRWVTLSRNAVAGVVVFVALAVWTLKFPAPLGPAAAEVTSDYLPRPGGQFVWLYQSLKYLHSGLGSIVGVVIPGLALLILLGLPWVEWGFLKRLSKQPQGLLASLILAAAAFWILTMTMTSYLSDRRDPRTRQQLVKQYVEEQAFRNAPFIPNNLNFGTKTESARENATPAAYVRFCANCHGANGEGGRQGALRFPPLLGVGQKPRRTVDDIVNLLNDPTAYGLEPPMRSFASKLTEEEKRQVAEWVVKLK